MPTGAILLRVSTARQADDDKASYDVQRDACLAYAAARGITVPDDLIWQEVGKRDQFYTRDGLQAALQAARERRYQVLIVWRMDRLTDDPGRLLSLVEDLDRLGVVIGYATEPDTNTDTPLGKWLAYTKALFQVGPERSTIALRTQQARRRYTEQGRAWASNRAPYGYQWVVDPSRTSKHGDTVLPLKERCTPDPITAPIVQQLYAWVADGRTLHWVARALSGLEDGGIHQQPTPRQYSGMAGANPNGLWLESAIAKLLKNPCYKGRYAAYRTKHVPRNDGSERYCRLRCPNLSGSMSNPAPRPRWCHRNSGNGYNNASRPTSSMPPATPAPRTASGRSARSSTGAWRAATCATARWKSSRCPAPTAPRRAATTTAARAIPATWASAPASAGRCRPKPLTAPSGRRWWRCCAPLTCSPDWPAALRPTTRRWPTASRW